MSIDSIADKIELAFVITSGISALCAFLVLLTFLVFPTMRTRYFMDIIIYISICDCLAATVSAFGFPSNDNPLCPIQSALNVYFFKASWTWTTMLAHQLFTISTKRKLGFSVLHQHLICWSIPLLCTLLPLTTNGFGRNDDGIPMGWCYLTGTENGYYVWFSITFLFLLIVCLFIMLYYVVRTYNLYKQVQRRELRATVEAIVLYPVGMIVCWLPNLTFVVIYSIVKGNSESALYISNIFTILACQNGLVTAFIFIAKCQEARYRWWKLLTCSDGKLMTESSAMDEGNTPNTSNRDFAASVGERILSVDEYFSDNAWIRAAREGKRSQRASNIDELMNDEFSIDENYSTPSLGKAYSPPRSATSPIAIVSPKSSGASLNAGLAPRDPNNTHSGDPGQLSPSSVDSAVGWAQFPGTQGSSNGLDGIKYPPPSAALISTQTRVSSSVSSSLSRSVGQSWHSSGVTFSGSGSNNSQGRLLSSTSSIASSLVSSTRQESVTLNPIAIGSSRLLAVADAESQEL